MDPTGLVHSRVRGTFGGESCLRLRKVDGPIANGRTTPSVADRKALSFLIAWPRAKPTAKHLLQRAAIPKRMPSIDRLSKSLGPSRRSAALEGSDAKSPPPLALRRCGAGRTSSVRGLTGRGGATNRPAGRADR